MRKLFALVVLSAVLLAGCSAQASKPDTKAIVQQVQAATVMLTTYKGDTALQYGSGFYCDAGLVTAAHVLAGADTVKITESDGTERTVGRADFAVDEKNDIALLKETPKQPLKWAAKSAEVGDRVLICGNPGGPAAYKYVSDGLVYGVGHRSNNYPNHSATGAVCYAGVSGGPTVDAKGSLVGMVVAGPTLENAEATPTIFIPLEVLKPAIERLSK